MKLSEKLMNFPKRTITKDELADIIGNRSDEIIFKNIKLCENNGLLKAIVSSGTNGNLKYPVYMKYRIIPPKNDNSDLLSEISSLHILLQKNGVLSKNPELYRSYRNELRLLSNYLFRKGTDVISISRKERSFEIFGEEKKLDKTAFCNLLKKLEISGELLGFYDTPEYCFHDYIPKRTPEMTVLICENKDIWFNIRRMMFENNVYTLWGTSFDGVLYGEGGKISEPRALTEYTKFLGDHSVNYLYWGDIDREGLNIFIRLCRNDPDIKISLFLPAYREMLNRAENIPVPPSDDKRGIMEDYSEIYKMFPDKYGIMLKNSISENKRIPQEIISYAVLLSEMR